MATRPGRKIMVTKGLTYSWDGKSTYVASRPILPA